MCTVRLYFDRPDKKEVFVDLLFRLAPALMGRAIARHGSIGGHVEKGQTEDKDETVTVSCWGMMRTRKSLLQQPSAGGGGAELNVSQDLGDLQAFQTL